MAKENPRNIIEAVESQVTGGCFSTIVISIATSTLALVGAFKIITNIIPYRQKPSVFSASSSR